MPPVDRRSGEDPEAEGGAPRGSGPPLPRDPSAVCRLIAAGELPGGYDLRGADLSGLALTDLDLGGADLSGARLDGSVLLRVDLRGCRLVGADLRRTRLRGGSLAGADLAGVRAGGARLEGADLAGARLAGTDLRGADLRGADLTRGDLSGADLRGADLSRARLAGAVLSGARTRGVRLRGATLDAAVLAGCDLSEARGVDRATRRTLRAAGTRVGPPGAPLVAAILRFAAGTAPAAALFGVVLLAWPVLRAVVAPLATAGRVAPPRVQAPPPPPPDPTVPVAGVPRHLRAPPLDFADGGFESGAVPAWGSDGAALATQPICVGEGPLPAVPEGAEGKCWLASDMAAGAGRSPPRNHGDDPTGTLTSGPFPIAGGTLVLMVGGGKGPNTRVDLLVDGEPRLQAHGQDDGVLREVRWDLGPFAGHEGRISIVDLSQGSWGRVLVDGIRVEGAPAAASRTTPAPAR